MGGFFGLAVIVLDVIAIIDAVKSSMSGTQKVLWIALVVIFPVIGTVLYFLLGKKGVSPKKEG